MLGNFIVIEGPDGAGTTTHSKLLAEALSAKGEEVLLTCEPTDGPIGKAVRDDLKSGVHIPPVTLQMDFVKDRAWHLEHVIEPALKEGKTVICDRYIPSTIVYGSVQGIDTEWLKSVNSKFIQPDRLIFLLPPYEVTRERLRRRESSDAFEEETFQKKVYDAYVQMAKENADIIIIDTTGKKEDVTKMILSRLL